MEGQGSIRLDDKDYDVSRGAGVYLGALRDRPPFKPPPDRPLKLFHLVVPRIPA